MLVVGELDEPNVWTDQNGNTRADLQLTARDVQFLNTRAEAETMDEAGGRYGNPAAPTGGGSGPSQEPGGEEDIPF